MTRRCVEFWGVSLMALAMAFASGCGLPQSESDDVAVAEAALAVQPKEEQAPISDEVELGAQDAHEHHAHDQDAQSLACPAPYRLCNHGWCVPYSTSKTCWTNESYEYTTTTQSSLVCSDSWSSTSSSAHAYQVTWDSWYIATADRSGHTRSISYQCSNSLQCGMSCNQTKQWNSGWLAHRLNRTYRPNYCLDCGAQFN